MFRNQNYRILVIDENANLTETIAVQLLAQGYTPITATTVESGLKLLCQESPDILLLSSKMTRQNSLDLCQNIRRDSAAPIILFDGIDSEDDLAAAFVQNKLWLAVGQLRKLGQGDVAGIIAKSTPPHVVHIRKGGIYVATAAHGSFGIRQHHVGYP